MHLWKIWNSSPQLHAFRHFLPDYSQLIPTLILVGLVTPWSNQAHPTLQPNANKFNDLISTMLRFNLIKDLIYSINMLQKCTIDIYILLVFFCCMLGAHRAWALLF